MEAIQPNHTLHVSTYSKTIRYMEAHTAKRAQAEESCAPQTQGTGSKRVPMNSYVCVRVCVCMCVCVCVCTTVHC